MRLRGETATMEAASTIISANDNRTSSYYDLLISLKRDFLISSSGAQTSWKAYIQSQGNKLDEVLGYSSVPIAGDELEVVDSLDTAREKAETCAVSLRDGRISSKDGDGMVTLSSLAAAISAGKQAAIDLHQLNVVMKVDLQSNQVSGEAKASSKAPGDALTCSVCLEQVNEGELIRTLPCLHQFHSNCIDPWLRQQGTCPVCKFRANEWQEDNVNTGIYDDSPMA